MGSEDNGNTLKREHPGKTKREETLYNWRKMTDQERQDILQERQRRGLPWHSPPHMTGRTKSYHFCAACYEHKPTIGRTVERLTQFSEDLLACMSELEARVLAWCVLPTHYHLLVKVKKLRPTIKHLGQLHGRTSFLWNGEENTRGRKNWCNVIDRWIRDERHFWTALNYIHHNPVRHGLAPKWQDWPFSSATDYLDRIGKEKAREIWYQYPVRDYGEGWLGREL